MKILITGSTGLIGRHLLDHLKGHELVLLTRDIEKAKSSLDHLALPHANYISDLTSFSNFDDIDVIINLAGEPIAEKKWTEEQKKIIFDSRCSLTEKLAQLCLASTTPPRCFISGSAIGYYGNCGNSNVDETTEIISDDFTHKLCRQWENTALQAQSDKTRVCILRTGVVLSTQGGALKKMLLPYQCGMGGPIGCGNQYMSWIHIEDMVHGILHLIEQNESQGIYNLTAPHPVSNRLFSQTLAKTLKRPHLFFIPNFAIKLMLGEASILLTDSQRVRPKHIVDEGFKFRYSRIESALKQLINS